MWYNKFMKKITYVLLAVSLLFVSCKHKQKDIVSIEEDKTIKNLIATKESETLWTREIEGEILTENISQFNNINTGIQLTPEVVSAGTIMPEKVYPSIKDFYVLDTSTIDKVLLKNLKTFGDGICKNINKGQEKLFNKNLKFTYVFFKESLQENWESIFNETCPYTFDEMVYGEKKIEIFDKYLIGKEYAGKDFIEVPVRLYKQNKYIDIMIYVEESKDFLFSNIEIKNWGE